jgi:hypothetical protein
MSQQPRTPLSPLSSESRRSTLAKLQRIYGRNGVALDVFGRRPALPSEIERLAAARQQPAARADEPCQRANSKKRG